MDEVKINDLATENLKKVIDNEKQAQLQLRRSRDSELEGITSWDVEQNDILAMAKLLSKTLRKGQGFYTVEESLVLAMHWKQTGLNPYMGEIFILDSGRIGLSVQGELKEAARSGKQVSSPKFTPVSREWPKMNGKPVELIRRHNKQDIPFFLVEEPGVKCEISVNGSPVEYTAWLTEWHMPANPNWYDRREHMLMIRSFGNALAFGTGVALSQDMTKAEGEPELVDVKVSAPKSIPMVAK